MASSSTVTKAGHLAWAEKVRAAMKARGLSAKALAKDTGFSASYIYNTLNLQKAPSAALLAALAPVLNLGEADMQATLASEPKPPLDERVKQLAVQEQGIVDEIVDALINRQRYRALLSVVLGAIAEK